MRQPRLPSHKLDNLAIGLAFIRNTWQFPIIGVSPNGKI